MSRKPLQLIKAGWLVFNQPNKPSTNRGFSLLEVLLAIAIFSLLIGVLVGAPLYGEEAVVLSGARGRATALAEEGLEAVRNLRDANYTNLTPGTYGLAITDNHWTLGSAPDTTGIFSRQLTITTLSENTMQITSTVTWQWTIGRTSSVTLTTYLTHWK
jgi:prepilin-type N-terminal cleavage/methylation domain-containing protein